MDILWRDYMIEVDKKLDKWIDEEYSENAEYINKYALYNEPISKLYRWYKKHPYEMSNIRTYLKVAEIDYKVVAFVVINYGMIDNQYVASLNPIVIDPKLMFKGLGTKILINFFENAEEILNTKVDVFDAGIDIDNKVSIHIFEKLGFKEIGRTEDKKFIYYQKENNQKLYLLTNG